MWKKKPCKKKGLKKDDLRKDACVTPHCRNFVVIISMTFEALGLGIEA